MKNQQQQPCKQPNLIISEVASSYSNGNQSAIMKHRAGRKAWQLYTRRKWRKISLGLAK